jgi:SRSO17 transposase
VTLSIAKSHASLPIAYPLYLPKEWGRRRKTHVPEEIGFKTKPEIAFEQIRMVHEAGVPRGVVLMDAGYGTHTRHATLCARSKAATQALRPCSTRSRNFFTLASPA